MFGGQASTKVDMEVGVADGEDNATVSMKKRKAMLARRYISKNAPKITLLIELICAGDKSSFTDFGALIGPVPRE